MQKQVQAGFFDGNTGQHRVGGGKEHGNEVQGIEGSNFSPGKAETKRGCLLPWIIAVQHQKAGQDKKYRNTPGAETAELPDSGMREEDSKKSDGPEALERLDFTG